MGPSVSRGPRSGPTLPGGGRHERPLVSFLSGREAFADALDLLVHIRAEHPSAESLRGSGRLGRWRAEIAGYDARLGVRAGEVLRRVEELRRSAEPEAGR